MHSSRQLGLLIATVLLSWGPMSSGALISQSREVLASSEPDYKIFLVRHGNTPANKVDLIQGWLDVDPDLEKEDREIIYQLDEQGKQEAENAANKLSEVPVGKIFSCPLGRALETAKRIQLEHPGVDIVQNGDLKGLNFGNWQGQSVDLTRNKEVNWEDGKVHGGESTAEYQERTYKFLEELLNDQAELKAPRNVIVSTHQWSIKLMVEYFMSKEATKAKEVDLKKYQTGGSISEIQVWLNEKGNKARYHVQRFGEEADKKPLA
ncbi:uncharacterized protein MELLADRAFT_58404 [Melampsora larici-populina 98AG31]|uniref:Phosphoglycerate mutase n=1 Tax=Melampsora larici-populina (strain 98AG31 / pathotype 3-4-7) TaxID=747676 RepID=F4R3E6_MELLP|nr:uncharacterized protein MELLADRAFT_58404 [Melampsora larici-populina 98AG31]EGG13183.1 hypothetical protein MELLADRAFT_58404 [Melampsora larici-populina 98AG31]